MAALTANRHGVVKADPKGFPYDAPLAAANTKIYAHSLVALDANGDLAPATAADAGPIFYSRKYYDATSDNLQYGHAGDEDVARVEYGVVALLNGSGFTIADVGERVYVTDDNTVTKTGTASAFVGVIRQFVSATQVFVYIPGLESEEYDRT